MKILVALTYYRPHVSGLTIYVERLSRALARRGHDVTVLTSHYEPSLPYEEMMDGVRVIRAPVIARVSRGVIMPTLSFLATKFVWQNDVLSLHLPQLDASGIATRARLFGKPSILTYHSDLLLPPTLINNLASAALSLSNHTAARLCDVVCAYTDDFARHSPYLSQYLHKVRIIPPPVEIPIPDEDDVQVFREMHGIAGKTAIGLGVRLAEEKGVEYLLEALPRLMERYPDAVIVHAGPFEAIGHSAYVRRIEPLLEKYKRHYVHVGTLTPKEMATFFRACHATVLPSINSTETFGLVQIESMLCGTPVVASDLPGVRQPTAMTGMGRIVPIRDSAALAEALIDVLDNREKYIRPRDEIAARFSPDAVAEQYEVVYEELKRR
ncbi:MAG: glycosyltransferase family 4 protein [Chloroflexi bacterium]|nr:glycosyltransferase family 4 protein [Chloroflexota bacterium]